MEIDGVGFLPKHRGRCESLSLRKAESQWLGDVERQRDVTEMILGFIDGQTSSRTARARRMEFQGDVMGFRECK